MSRGRTLCREVHPGIFQLRVAYTNCYLLAADEGLTLIDSGLPRTWPLLSGLLTEIGAEPDDISAVLATHAHFDHLGMSRRLHDEYGVPTLVHHADLRIARNPFGYHPEVPVLPFALEHPRGWPILLRMAAGGALWTRGVDAVPTLFAGEQVDVPGRPRVVASKGHTNGHVGFHLTSEGVVFSGDALVTLDPYTGREGPRITAPAATNDTGLALRNLDALAELDAPLLLPGHGPPWRGGTREAVRRARTGES